VTTKPIVSVSPTPQIEYLRAIALGGGIAADLGPETTGLVWTDSQGCVELEKVLSENPGINWVQLPFAGVDNFKPVFDSTINSGRELRFTSAKGAYREPVAEHALMLALALARALPERIRANTWGEKFAATLFDSKVLILGGGGIAQEILRLLTPFRVTATVFRRSSDLIDGAKVITSLNDLDSEIADADFIFIASALTSETQGLFDSDRFALMKPSAYLINIARGGIVDSLALEQALRNGTIAGAGIDVTDPEPLPDGHSLWSVPNLIITPHTADTPEMCVRLLSERIVRNVSALASNAALEGSVNLKLGY
jgi:phosphoglycerate dehydrogenase-like enzyme